MPRLRLKNIPLPVLLVWAALGLEFVTSLLERQWPLAFVAALTFALTLLPIVLAPRVGIRLPMSFTAAIVLFIFATIFLGEAFDFYNRYWWWDMVLHGGSALGFGLVGFLFVFMLFEGDRYAAPAWALGLIAFSFAVTIGAVWEIFEYGMDQIFGFNMQKSGLHDTMKDLIVDVIGAAIGATVGALYMKGRELGGLSKPLKDFVTQNAQLFRRSK
ncbi:hypothetical protein EKE94_00135 [Mesobaculum littorinae]|uniref:Membrane protein YjdF n=1 Tax=Mesobaculum littorinae TaxID=2486419 RepID=A0A438AKC6_9RHOB|nr:hypothetical protein [Mesobaculum littorinae]RVV99142.1 hypothetical protein EKE94_00135 [Mesobaculum littorinae]